MVRRALGCFPATTFLLKLIILYSFYIYLHMRLFSKQEVTVRVTRILPTLNILPDKAVTFTDFRDEIFDEFCRTWIDIFSLASGKASDGQTACCFN